MEYLVTYTVKGLITVFKDVVEVDNINDCESAVQKLVNEFYGNKPINIIFIKEK